MDEIETHWKKGFFKQPLSIGSLTIPNRVILAPLASVSDQPFRRICQELGAGLTYVEMLTAISVVRRSKRTLDLLRRHEDESVLGVQITGRNEEETTEGNRFLATQGFETIDINMGCPVRKIVKKGCGSAILLDPERVSTTVSASCEAVDVPLTAKIRTGYAPDQKNVEDVASRIARAGAPMLTIHGRTRGDNYSVPVNYEDIRKGFEAARGQASGITLTGNGDVMDLDSARAMIYYSGADAVMVSRGALGNPWIFDQLVKEHRTQPTFQEWYEVLLRHIEYHEAFYGEGHVPAIMFRKHLLWYVKGFPLSRHMRNELSTVDSLKEARERLKPFAKKIPGDLRRFTEAWRMPDREYDPKFEMDRKLDRGVGLREDE